jgi:basic amino acid/polyamine antiporter, APA family
MSSAVALPSVAAPPRRGLLRVLGVAFGVAVIVGNSIGAGILRTPGDVAARLPSPELFLAAWVAGGVYALLGVASIAELGVLFPRSGGQYVFARETFGEYAGFVIGWTDWFSTCASAAAMAFVIAQLMGGLAAPLDRLQAFVAVAVTLAFVLLQWRGIRSGDRVQRVTTALKALAFIALVAAAFATAPAAREAATAAPSGAVPLAAPLSTPLTMAAVVIAMQGVIFTYDGWNGMIFFSGELRDPGRDIPRGMFAGVAAVIVIYLLLNAAFLHVLGMPGLAGSEFAAGATATAIFGARGDDVIRVLMIVSLASGLNAVLLMGSRIPYAMGSDRLLPRWTVTVNDGGTPTAALAVSALLVVGLIVTGTFESVIAIAAFFFVLQYVVSFLAVFVLRRRRPDAPRPYRALGYPVTTAISLLGGLAFLVAALVQDRSHSLIALGVLAASWPAYRLVRRLRAPAPH